MVLQELPAHRYRMNALLARTRGRMAEYRRTCDRLWAEARRIDADVLLRMDDGSRRTARVAAAQTGPARGPFLVDLALATAFSSVALRFQAQRRTLESAVDAVPSLWGASAAVDVDPADLSASEAEAVLLAAVDQIVPAGSLVHPWCTAADALRARMGERLSRLEGRVRALRAWRVARQHKVLTRATVRALALRGVLRAWWTERQEGPGRCRVAVVGRDASALARTLMGLSFLDVRRVGDESSVYTPSCDFPGEAGTRDLVVTGPWDGGLWTEPVDALVLLDGCPPIDRAVAAELEARVVVEAGETIVLPEADGTLAGRHIDVLPDLLFAAAEPIACRSLVDGRRTTSSFATRLGHDIGALVREVVRDATVRGRSIREQLYLRALANLHG